MDLADFVKKLPVTLVNHHSSSVSKVPLTSYRTKTIYENDYLDAGGSGIFVHRLDKSRVKGYKLKNDSLVGSPFYPKCFTLPLVVSDRERYQESSLFYCLDKFHGNSLLYDSQLGFFFYADPIRNKLTFHKLERDPEHLHKTSIDTVSAECSFSTAKGAICEISPSHTYGSDSIALIRQQTGVSIVQKVDIGDGESSLNAEPLVFVDEGKQQTAKEIWKISKSHLLEHSLAVGFLNEKEDVEVKDFNIETGQFIWSCENKRPNDKLDLRHPVNLFWAKNHPKLLTYCELDGFVIFDTRSSAMKSVMEVKNLELCREWERFRGACQLSIKDEQFILALDHKLVLIDNRFPQQNLLQWNHMLPVDSTNPLKFLSSTTIDDVGSVITLSNKNQACLITVNPFDINITQPQSLHFPLHLSQPVDSWHFSSNVDESIRVKLENIELTGLLVLPDQFGYLICQSTSGGDFWVQEFFPKDAIDVEQRFSWKRNCCSENVEIDLEVKILVENAFSKFEQKFPGSQSSTKFYFGHHFDPSRLVEIQEPKMIMDLPGIIPTTNDEENDDEDEDEDENESESFQMLISKHVNNLMVDEVSSLSENKYTLNMLSKWRNNTSGQL